MSVVGNQTLTPDIVPEVLNAFRLLMIAQAQECFYDKASTDPSRKLNLFELSCLNCTKIFEYNNLSCYKIYKLVLVLSIHIKHSQQQGCNLLQIIFQWLNFFK